MVTPTWVVRPPAGPRLVHVNSTSTGGGVAELLHGLVPAQAAAGVRVGWAVIDGTADFYALTKSIHHLVHGRGDPTVLADAARTAMYRDILAVQANWLTEQTGAGDVVVLHDPQTLGLAPRLAASGAKVVWHCHIGTTRPGGTQDAVWRSFAAELSCVDTVVTTLPEFAPSGVDPARLRVCAPAIDPKSPKNRELSAGRVDALLASIGLTEGGQGTGDCARLEQDCPVPAGARLVLQVSRWDPLKDMPGVARCVPDLPTDTHLVLAGTDPREIPDDPDGLAVLAETRAVVAAMPERDRRRIHLVHTFPQAAEQAALVVNALQRRADVVLQKSLAEGFGLTVTEAMIKRRAVVAADVGGLRTQVAHGRTGLLVDPADHRAAVSAVRSLLADPGRRRTLGAAAAESVRGRYTMARLVADYQRFAAPESSTVEVIL